MVHAPAIEMSFEAILLAATTRNVRAFLAMKNGEPISARQDASSSEIVASRSHEEKSGDAEASAAVSDPGGMTGRIGLGLNPDGAKANVTEGSISPEGRDLICAPSETELGCSSLRAVTPLTDLGFLPMGWQDVASGTELVAATGRMTCSVAAFTPGGAWADVTEIAATQMRGFSVMRRPVILRVVADTAQPPAHS